MEMRSLRPILVTTAILVAFTSLLLNFGLDGRDDGNPPRLVLLVATCTVNKSYLSAYNSLVNYTPAIEAFSSQSVTFSRHVTETGQSGPSYASIFTGTHADRHGVYSHPSILSDKLYTITEAFGEAGYEPYFWAGHPMARPGLNYAQGVPWSNVFDGGLRADSADFRSLLDRLRRDKETSTFVLTNFTDTHGPYKKDHLDAFLRDFPDQANGLSKEDILRWHDLYTENFIQLQWNHPAAVKDLGLKPEEVKEMASAIEVTYRSRIHLLDQRLGALIEELESRDLLEESLIVLTADHGEVLLREDLPFKWTHGPMVTSEIFDVPFILYAPGLGVEARRYESVTRSIDVFPTMAGLAGVDLAKDAGLSGVDLSPVLRGVEAEPQLLGFSHTGVRYGPRWKRTASWTLFRKYFQKSEDPATISVALRRGDLLLALQPDEERVWRHKLYDLSRLPLEREDLFDAGIPEHQAMARLLDEYRETLVSSYRPYRHSKDKELRRPVNEEEEIRHLKSLGYL